jgi:hypothetical protein
MLSKETTDWLANIRQPLGLSTCRSWSILEEPRWFWILRNNPLSVALSIWKIEGI